MFTIIIIIIIIYKATGCRDDAGARAPQRHWDACFKVRRPWGFDAQSTISGRKGPPEKGDNQESVVSKWGVFVTKGIFL